MQTPTHLLLKCSGGASICGTPVHVLPPEKSDDCLIFDHDNKRICCELFVKDTLADLAGSTPRTLAP